MDQQHLEERDRLGRLLLRRDDGKDVAAHKKEGKSFKSRTKAQNKYSRSAFL